MQTDPKHPPEQTATSNGLLQNVRILLSTHSHRQSASAVLTNVIRIARRSAGVARIFTGASQNAPVPPHATEMVAWRLCFDLD